MIAVDSNILVYAHRADSEWHAPAAAAMKSLAEGRGPWAIPWPCVHEFLAIVTNPRVYDPPSTIDGDCSITETETQRSTGRAPDAAPFAPSLTAPAGMLTR